MPTLEQQIAEQLIFKTNDNVFIHGKAGTGKSYFLNQIIKPQAAAYGKKPVFLASTGLAAKNISGRTLHSFLYLHSFDGNLIIIDEISMVRADLLDKLDEKLRILKQNNQVFGGVQMVFVGDLYQLPPVVRMSEPNKKKAFKNPFPQTAADLSAYRGRKIQKYDSQFFLSANCIRQTYLHIVDFTKVYRQENLNFLDLLNKVRTADLDAASLAQINGRLLPAGAKIPDTDMYLSATNKVADTYNEKRLLEQSKQTGQPVYTIRAQNYPANIDENLIPPTPEELKICVGARVMMTKNGPKNGNGVQAYVNGDIGTVKKIKKSEDGYIIEVYLNRGATVYLTMVMFDIKEELFNNNTGEIYERCVAKFAQIPLRLAWALTIHKSQGQTFNSIVLDLGDEGAFESGQTYVALSRCRTIEGVNLTKMLAAASVKTEKDIIEKLIETQKKVNKFIRP